jgi:outer membrane protein
MLSSIPLSVPLSIVLLCACTTVYAQSATTLMPEGTTDVDLGAVAAIVPRAEGRLATRFVLLPTVSAQWSNGIFAAPGAVGMRLSGNPRWNVGPLLTYGVKPERADSLAHRETLGVEAGGFLSYNVAYNITLSSQALYGGGHDNRGARFTGAANYNIRLSPHQSLDLRAGFTAVNASYMNSYFGVSAQASRQFALSPYYWRLSPYYPGAGVKNVFATVSWNIELSPKYAVRAGGSESRLMKVPAGSPLVTQRNNPSLFTQLTYHW